MSRRGFLGRQDFCTGVIFPENTASETHPVWISGSNEGAIWHALSALFHIPDLTDVHNWLVFLVIGEYGPPTLTDVQSVNMSWLPATGFRIQTRDLLITASQSKASFLSRQITRTNESWVMRPSEVGNVIMTRLDKNVTRYGLFHIKSTFM